MTRNFPPYEIRVVCHECEKRGVLSVEVSVDEIGQVFTEIHAPCPCLENELEEYIRNFPELYTLWGGRRGYCVVPLGVIVRFGAGGYKFAAPGEDSVEILGKRDDIYVGIVLSDYDYPSDTPYRHLPYDNGRITLDLNWLKERIVVGVDNDGLVMFQRIDS